MIVWDSAIVEMLSAIKEVDCRLNDRHTYIKIYIYNMYMMDYDG